MLTNENSAKSRFVRKANFYLHVEYYVTWRSYLNNIIILLFLLWYTTIQYRKRKLRWIFFVYMFFRINYSWRLLRFITFYIQVKIGLYVMLPTLESFNRPFMRLWFCTAFIQIEFGLSMRSFHWNYTKF